MPAPLRDRVLVVLSLGVLAGCHETPASAKAVAARPVLDGGRPASIVRPEPGPGSVSQDSDGAWRLHGHREPIYSVAVSVDGRRAATGSGDRSVRIWDLERHAEAFVVKGANEAITALAFSPDGRLLAAGDRAYSVRLIRVADGTVVRTQPHPDAVSTIDFSPDGHWLLVAGYGGNAEVYPVDAAGLPTCDLRGRSGQFTDAGKRLVLASQVGKLSLYDFPACKLLKETSTVPQLPFANASARATLVATHNGRESPVLLWDAVAGKLLGKLEGHSAGVTTSLLSPDGARALTASEDGSVRIWDVEKRQVLQRIAIAGGTPFAAMSGDGALIVIAAGIDARVVAAARQ